MPSSYSKREETLLQACTVLFGSHLDISPSFLDYIQLTGVKTAYRTRVKETHPDVMVTQPDSFCPEHDFYQVRESYEQLCRFLAQRDTSVAQPGVRLSPAATAGSRRHSPQSFARNSLSSLPSRRMMLAEFLQYLGFCTWSEVNQALIWQRRNRPRLGEIGCNFGWMSPKDITTILHSIQGGIRFGETARQLGILTPQQVTRMLQHQQIRQPKIGQFFLRNKHLSPKELQDALWHLSKHNFLMRK